MNVFTSITLNYLPKARILAKSVKRFHPDWIFHVVISDKIDARYNLGSEIDLEQEPFDNVIWVDDLGIENQVQWIFMHTVVEISTAVKGTAFVKFAEQQVGKVIYLDPDIAVFNPLDELEELLDDHDILLTPHLVQYQTDPRSIRDNEINSALVHGVFNLGFLAVNTERNSGREFSRWWADRLIEYCYDDKENGLFTDQKWCDLVPCFFNDYFVIRNPGYNVASWNLAKRELSYDDEGTIRINGKFPLRFYHFTGFDSGAGHTMTQLFGKGNIIVDEIWAWYRRELKKAGQEEADRMTWFYNYYSNGEKIPREARTIYRLRPDLRAIYQNPFESNWKQGGYNKWYQKENK
jgi:hypothetical protein